MMTAAAPRPWIRSAKARRDAEEAVRKDAHDLLAKCLLSRDLDQPTLAEVQRLAALPPGSEDSALRTVGIAIMAAQRTAKAVA